VAEAKRERELKEDIKLLAESDLFYFMQLVNPHYVYGDVHERLARFLTVEAKRPDQLALLPREHLKSHVIACWVAWWITKHPEVTVLYVSATEDLSRAQLGAIKNLITCPVYRRYWPEMVNEKDATRACWNMDDMDVDHPARKLHGVRDHTVSARSVGANTTGLHCDVLALDDVVAPNNAYTEEGRKKVAGSYSQFASVMNTGGFQKVVGTRYHGKDIYGIMIDMTQDLYDQNELVGEEKVYDVMVDVVEVDGNFLWPRAQHPLTKKWFGFDQTELARKRAKYLAAGERMQYFAQYYNNPEDPDKEIRIGEHFQYYDPSYLKYYDGEWWYSNKHLRLFAGGDLAYTVNSRSDYTAFAVIGLDEDGFIYLLDIERFRTDKYSVYYDAVRRLHEKWGFVNMRIEAQTGGAGLVVKYIQDEARADGRVLVVEGKGETREKMERFAAILEPRYEANSVLHFRGGHITEYENEVTLARPAHDDIRDAVCIAVEISRPARKRHKVDSSKVVPLHARFGGYRR
jgi:phage terminase large subunit-like protein